MTHSQAASAAAGIALGVASRVEELTPMSAGISSDAAWVLVAFAAGAMRGAGELPPGPEGTCSGGAAAGAIALTAAMTGYYAVVVLCGDPLSIAGPPGWWLTLGMVAGAVFGAAGRRWRAGDDLARAAAATALGAVLIADGATALTAGRLTDLPGLLAGVVFPVVGAQRVTTRRTVAAAVAGILVVAASGAFEAALP